MSEKEIEEIRRSKVMKMILMFIGMIIKLFTIAFIIHFITKTNFGNKIETIMTEGIIVLVIIIINIQRIIDKKNNFKKEYKEFLLPIVIKKILNNGKYSPEAGEIIISECGVIHIGKTFKCGDYIQGSYKGINVEMCDVFSADDIKCIKFFEGQLIVFDFNKKFRSNIEVIEKNNKTLYSKIGEKIELEDMEFNKAFDVFANNELEAYYILTPKLMEQLKQLQKIIDGDLLFEFKQNKLYIAIFNKKDLFEINILKKINIEKYCERSFDSIINLIKFAEILDLSNDLFE